MLMRWLDENQIKFSESGFEIILNISIEDSDIETTQKLSTALTCIVLAMQVYETEDVPKGYIFAGLQQGLSKI